MHAGIDNRNVMSKYLNTLVVLSLSLCIAIFLFVLRREMKLVHRQNHQPNTPWQTVTSAPNKMCAFAHPISFIDLFGGQYDNNGSHRHRINHVDCLHFIISHSVRLFLLVLFFCYSFCLCIAVKQTHKDVFHFLSISITLSLSLLLPSTHFDSLDMCITIFLFVLVVVLLAWKFKGLSISKTTHVRTLSDPLQMQW